MKNLVILQNNVLLIEKQITLSIINKLLNILRNR